jgi:hypothetical protein
VSQAFSSPIRSVSEVEGGLLVVAEQGAALFDCRIGEWQPALRTSERLQATG